MSSANLAVTPSSMLALFPAAAGGAGFGGGAALAGAAGGDSAARVLSRSSFDITILPSTASAGFSFTDSAPEPLLSPSTILKSLAAKSACEASTLPSKLNLPASSGGK